MSKKKISVDWIRIHFKEYPRLDIVKLHRFQRLKMSLDSAIRRRESRRLFTGKQISVFDLSKLLFYSAGITHSDIDNNQSRRSYPSGGARYPLEVYVLILKGSIKPGLYHYNVKRHYLESLLKGDFSKSFRYLYEGHSIKNISALLIITSITSRSSIKYGPLANKFELVEAGHIGQNIYLVCEAMKIGCCAIGWYNENGLNKLLDIDGIYEHVVHLVAIGKRN